MDLLLLSSSRTPAGYLTDYLADIKTFSAGVRRALFVPFAAVSLPWDEYASKVRGLLAAMREKVKTGTRYLGWSAGANLACPTIKTTNDMPIVDPGALDALGLIGFQINPRYVSVSLPGHHGETRDERLAEFARVNPKLPVIALPEGAWLRVSDSTVELRGPYPAVLFAGENPPRQLRPGKLPPNFGDSA